MAESLHVLRERDVVMIVAIDSTRLGPALGGCRWKRYSSSAEARAEALALAGAMTRKAALARVGLGGGKAVVVADPATRNRQQLLAFGDFVASLGGRYIAAADMGTSEREMAVIRERTPHVCGWPQAEGGAGDPGPYTALGVRLALETVLEHLGKGLERASFAIQGAGSVGRPLALGLHEAGARVLVSDVDPRALATLPARVERIPADDWWRSEVDVLVPCGPPGAIELSSVAALRCAAICGGANNPLCGSSVDVALAERGILYAPDFVVNSGGVIHLSVARAGGDAEASRKALRVIALNLEAVFAQAAEQQVTPAAAAEALAARRLNGDD